MAFGKISGRISENSRFALQLLVSEASADTRSVVEEKVLSVAQLLNSQLDARTAPIVFDAMNYFTRLESRTR